MRLAAAGLLLPLAACEAPAPAEPPRHDPPVVAGPVAPAPLEPGEVADAEARVTEACLVCHSARMIEQQRLTGPQWAAVVDKMRGWGARLGPEEAPLVARHLTARYGSEAATWSAPPIPADEAAARLDPHPDRPEAGATARAGGQLYRTACAQCHGGDARGSTGPSLVDRPLLWRADDFARAVRTGRARMPAFPEMRDVEVRSLLAHLRAWGR